MNQTTNQSPCALPSRLRHLAADLAHAAESMPSGSASRSTVRTAVTALHALAEDITGPGLRSRLHEAFTREHNRRADEHIVASPADHQAAFADIAIRVLAGLPPSGPARVRPMRYEVALLPPGHPSYYQTVLSVDRLGDGWAVHHGAHCLDATGNWSSGAHRFEETAALTLAAEAASDVRAEDGRRAGDLLGRGIAAEGTA